MAIPVDLNQTRKDKGVIARAVHILLNTLQDEVTIACPNEERMQYFKKMSEGRVPAEIRHRLKFVIGTEESMRGKIKG